MPSAPETKRKYRRHPKPDDNAPEKPPSAYVILSHKVREEIKDQNLSFTVIAKLVGDRWQKLDPAGKEPYEAQAAAAKDRYNIQLSTYKKTDAYADYTQYLTDFRAKHGNPSEGKKPRLELESSGGSISTKSVDAQESAMVSVPGHVRGGSMGSMSSSSMTAPMPSPAAAMAQSFSFNNSGSMQTVSKISAASPRSGSPRHGRERRTRPPISTHSSCSDDSTAVRSEQSDTLMRTATLSLASPHSGTPPMPPLAGPGSLSDFPNPSDALLRSRWPHGALPGASGTFAGGFHSGYANAGQSLAATSPNEDAWQPRAFEPQTLVEVPRTRQLPGSFTVNNSFGTTALPGRLSAELPMGQSLRTLPPPAFPGPILPQAGTRTLPWPGDHARLGQVAPRVGGSTYDDSRTQLERWESEAADALAGLAGRGSSTPRKRDHDEKPPP